jgi:hypothetical protein
MVPAAACMCADFETGEEHAFDLRCGEESNLLSFGATDDRIVMRSTAAPTTAVSATTACRSSTPTAMAPTPMTDS